MKKKMTIPTHVLTRGSGHHCKWPDDRSQGRLRVRKGEAFEATPEELKAFKDKFMPIAAYAAGLDEAVTVIPIALSLVGGPDVAQSKPSDYVNIADLNRRVMGPVAQNRLENRIEELEAENAAVKQVGEAALKALEESKRSANTEDRKVVAPGDNLAGPSTGAKNG